MVSTFDNKKRHAKIATSYSLFIKFTKTNFLTQGREQYIDLTFSNNYTNFNNHNC